MNPITLWQLLFEPQFQAGLFAGLVAAALGLLVQAWAGRRRSPDRWSPDWGFLWAAATLAAAAVIGLINPRVAERVIGTYSWANTGAFLSVAAAAVGIYFGRDRRGLPLAIGLTIGGVWATVPDTESIGILMGVTAASLWIWWPRPIIRIGTLGAVLVPALIMTTALLGGANRASGLMGGIGVIGALLIFSIGRPTNATIDVGIQLLVVLGWSRWAGLSGSAPLAFSIGVFVTVLGVAAKLTAPLLLERRRAQPARDESVS